MRLFMATIAAILLCGFGFFPSGGPESPQQMCSAISGGCAEAWGIAEASVSSYSGPLFQISNGSSTLDIGQVGGGNFKADMTTWSAFCGGTNSTSGGITTNNTCFISKIYAEVHGHANDLVPSVFNAPFGPNCISGANACACPFRYETATGLPILYKTSETCEYTLAGDGAVTGVTSGTASRSLFFNGLPNQISVCCGQVGLAHVYNAADTPGTDFELYTAHGQGSALDCLSPTNYCLGIDEEGIGDGIVYTPPSGSIFLAINYNSSANSVSAWVNGSLGMNNSPPQQTINTGKSIHVGGGGDLSQPAPIAVREFALTNTAVTLSDVQAAFTQVKTNFAGLITFGTWP